MPVRGVQRDECVHDRFRARRTAVEIVLAHRPASTFLHGDGAHAPPSRCRATVLRPEITDHYRSDTASEPRLVGAVRPASPTLSAARRSRMPRCAADGAGLGADDDRHGPCAGEDGTSHGVPPVGDEGRPRLPSTLSRAGH